VIVDFEFRSILVYLRVHNIGTTIARDVKIKFNKPLQSSRDGVIDIADSPVFRDGIPMMAPDRKISVLFDSYVDRAQRRSELPMRYEVSVEYSDTEGKRYRDPAYPLDLDMYEGSSLPPKNISDLVDRVDNMVNEMKKWTSGIDGILVHAVDEDRRRARRIRPVVLRNGATILKQQGLKAYGRWLMDRQLKRYGWRR
jgi:hypothetical protein